MWPLPWSWRFSRTVEGDSGLLWTFDQNLRSVYAEQSSLTVSRFRNVLDLAHAAGKPVPDEIYDLAFDSSRPDIALLAIRSNVHFRAL